MSTIMKSILPLLFLPLLIGSCKSLVNECGSSKEAFLKKHVELIETAKEGESNDRQKLDKTFRKLTQECIDDYSEELSATERVEYWQRNVQYYYLRYGQDVAGQFATGGNEIAEKMGSELQKIVDEEGGEIEEAFQNIIKDIDPESIDKITEEISKGIKEIGDGLKEALEEIKIEN